MAPTPYPDPTTDIGYGRWPGRGLLYSFLIHQIVFSSVLFLSAQGFWDKSSRDDEQVQIIDLKRDAVLYLPTLAPESRDGGETLAHQASESRQESAEPMTKATPGLTYPGPVRIVSDLPQPTNRFQTLLQPALVNPPTLSSPILLPNFVQMTNAGPQVGTPTAPPEREPAKIAALEQPNATVTPRPASIPVVNPLYAPPLRATPPPVSAPAQLNPLDRPDPIVAGRIASAAGRATAPLPELRATPPPASAPAQLKSLDRPDPIVTGQMAAASGFTTAPLPELRATPPPSPMPRLVLPIGQPGPATPSQLSPLAPLAQLSSPMALTDMRAQAPPSMVPPSLKAVEGPAPLTVSPNTSARVPGIPALPPARSETPTAPPMAIPPSMAPVAPLSAVASSPSRAPVPTTGRDLRNLLSVNPLPPPPEPQVRVPAGEARGKVALSPDANLTARGSTLGVNVSGPSSPKAALGKEAENRPPATADKAPDKPADKPNDRSTPTTPAKDAPKNDNRGNSSSSPEPGKTTSAPGVSPGRNTPSTGAVQPANPFAGITIQGGTLEPSVITGTPGTINITRPGTLPPGPATPYNITIVATAGSGGGLPDFGVFANEQVFTVYLDVKPSAAAAPRSWTLQYAVPDHEPAPNTIQDQSGSITPPFPMEKEYPQFSAELLRKYAQHLMVVYAELDTGGKLRRISVKQTPDPVLNAAAVAALEKWIFRPAEVGGQPVVAKILLGIPLAP